MNQVMIRMLCRFIELKAVLVRMRVLCATMTQVCLQAHSLNQFEANVSVEMI